MEPNLDALRAEQSALIAERDEIAKAIEHAAIEGDGVNLVRLKNRRDELNTLLPSFDVKIARATMAEVQQRIADLTAQLPEADADTKATRAEWEAKVVEVRHADSIYVAAQGKARGIRYAIQDCQAELAVLVTRHRDARELAAGEVR